MTWFTTCGFGGTPTPRGPWKTPEEARAALSRWASREAADAGQLINMHTVRVSEYRTRYQARAGDISDDVGQWGLVSTRGYNDFMYTSQLLAEKDPDHEH